MRIGLIGMSGAGKTSWATKLAAAGFEHIDCDRRIADRLSAEVNQPITTFQELGEWLAFPYEPGFRAREARFMACEVAILQDIVDQLSQSADQTRDLVVDMGGSAIYAGEPMFLQLRHLMTVVYLAITPAIHTQMLQEYMARPRPIIWNGLFQCNPYEIQTETLERCFSQLIIFRERQYEALCDVKIDYEQHHHPELDIDDFLRLINKKYPTAH
jgi:shikimate kinase